MSGVVIGVGAAIGAVVGGGSAIHGMSKQNRSTISMFKKQMYYMQLNYNYNQAALDRQERSLYDSAVGNLFQLSMNAFQNQSSVEAAQAESGVEGRTQDKLGQVIRGQNARQITSAKEAYEVDVWNVRSKKEALYIETKNAVEQAKTNLDNSLIYGSRAFSQFMGSAIQGAAIGAATAGVASAAGGALAGGAASGGAGAAGGMGTLSTTGIAVPGVAQGTITASSVTTASTGASTAAGLGAVGGAMTPAQQAMSTAMTQSTASQTGGFMSHLTANFQQYKPYVDFVQQWSNFFNQNAQYRQQRGGYFY